MEAEVLFSPTQVDKVIQSMAEEAWKLCKDEKPLLIVGIQSGGLIVARTLREALESRGMKGMVLGSVDTTLYRDDVHRLMPEKGLLPMEIPISVEDTAILLVDDVIFTGRSARAAMDALFCLGRPKRIRLAVLVDRGHRELPIQPDVTGVKILTAYGDDVKVTWTARRGKIEIIHGDRGETRET